MSNDNLLQIDSEQRRSPQRIPNPEDTIDLQKIFRLVVLKWHYFLVALVIALICAFLYNVYTIPTYRVSVTLLIDEEKKAISMENNPLLEGFGLGAGMKNLDNQIMVLSSRTLIGRTLDELSYDIEYYQTKLFNKIALYPDSPIKIIPETGDSLPRDIEFTLKYLDNNLFNLTAETNDLIDLQTKASFGELIKTRAGSFRIDLSLGNFATKNSVHEMKFMIHSRNKLIDSYTKRLKVEAVSKKGTIVRMSLEGTNKAMDIDFLNKLTEIFLNNSLDKKNQEAIRTIQFIDDQLIGISDSLVINENKLQQFRSQNKVMNLSSQGQVIINQAMSLDNEKSRLGIEANYYNYLAEYLSKDNVGEVPIAPATMGITDQGLTKLVADLAELQGQLYSKSLGEKNPLQSQLAQRVHNIKGALMETLNGVRRANALARLEVDSQIHTVNAQATALPVTERQLLGIERKFKLNDELYTFLLEKRAVAQIQKASNVPDNELIDPSESDTEAVRPKTTLIYIIAIISGFGLPFFWFILANFISYKVRDEEDIIKITQMPIAGHVPHSIFKTFTVIFEEPHSSVAEAFRSLRSRMQFFIKDKKSPVILITSSISEEGKTFTAINLASAYSLMDKKTVLIGFDLRRPKIYSDFGIENNHGVSTWLIGRDNIDDVIQATTHENLSIIPSGPIPPNPSELTFSARTDELFKLLKEKFDYIIIDSPPIGVVSDTFHLAALADTCIIMIRLNKTSKDMIEKTIDDLKISDIKSTCLVINDITIEKKGFGYGGKYDYGYGYFNSNSEERSG